MPRELVEAIRVAKFEVDSVQGEWAETTKRWHATSDQCKQAVNLIWQTWLCWHVTNGSAGKLREWLNKRAEVGKKEAGKCPVEAIPKSLSKAIYKAMTTELPNLHTRVVVLIQNTIQNDLKKHKASKGSLPGWSAVLLCHQSIPSSTRPIPVPFDKANATIVTPENHDGDWNVQLKTWRIPVEGKRFRKSVEDSVKLRTRGRKVRGEFAKLKRIASGEYDFRGSNLLYDRKKKKWFLHLCYRMPVRPRKDLDKNTVAYLVPGRDVPFRLWLLDEKGKRFYRMPGGRGRHIPVIRKRTILHRLNRSQGYRFVGSNIKGHGRERGMSWKDILTRKWRNCCKLTNYIIVSDIIKECEFRGIGSLAFCKPSDWGKRYLSTAGKLEDIRDSSSWEWFQFESILKRKCQEAGVAFTIAEKKK